MKKIAFFLIILFYSIGISVASADNKGTFEVNGPSKLTHGVPLPSGMELIGTEINEKQGAWEFSFEGNAKSGIEEYARALRAKGWNIEYVAGNQDLWGGAAQLEANDGQRYLQMVIEGAEDHHRAQMKIFENRPEDIKIQY
ncbi:hypothetical protein [Persicobacter diffluens]